MELKDARTITPAALYDRRKQAVMLFQRGMSRREIAPIVGVTAYIVGRWIKAWQEGGYAALKARIGGRPKGSGRKLFPHKEHHICRCIIDHCPDQLKLNFALWTRNAILALIPQEFGITMTLQGLSKKGEDIMIKIREFQENDAAEASVVYFRSFKSYLKERMETEEPRPAEYWLDLMKHTVNSETESISFVAEADGKVIGCISITAALRRHLGYLNRIGVLPEYAGKGVGRMLFESARQFWLDRNMRKICTCVSSINPKALEFYRNCGFHREGILKNHFFDGVDEHQLALFFR